jgi:hypothetical protein
MPRRRPTWSRRPSEIPAEELTGLIKKMCEVLEMAGEKGVSLGNLLEIAKGKGVASAFGLGILALKEKAHIYSVEESGTLRYYLTNKYYEDKRKVEGEI